MNIHTYLFGSSLNMCFDFSCYNLEWCLVSELLLCCPLRIWHLKCIPCSSPTWRLPSYRWFLLWDPALSRKNRKNLFTGVCSHFSTYNLFSCPISSHYTRLSETRKTPEIFLPRNWFNVWWAIGHQSLTFMITVAYIDYFHNNYPFIIWPGCIV